MSNTTVLRHSKTRRLTYLAVFIALSTVGANLKIPSITGTPAFDSFPAFLAALLLGPGDAAIIGALGHMLTALTAGFPLTIPIHLVIAVGMAGIVALFSVVSRRSLWLGIIVGLILNGIIFPALFIPIPTFGKPFFLAMIIPLLIASAFNIALAEVVFRPLSRVISPSYVKGHQGQNA
ncbi:MAG TPA: ECF transporter S component [Desulfobacteria bacterium]|nr:ECF transporter S component [Desulfobacteria bacterium]